MGRGGRREGAGRKTQWESGCSFSETTVVRVPKYLKDEVLKLAHRLDAGEVIDLDTESLKKEISRLSQQNIDLSRKIEEISNQPQQMDIFQIGYRLPDGKVLYKIRDKIMAKGMGKYASQSEPVKQAKKKFTQFIKILLSDDLSSYE